MITYTIFINIDPNPKVDIFKNPGYYSGSEVPGSRLKSTENGLHLQIRCGVHVETLPVEDLRIIMAMKRRER
jgi:hypothetical protein